MIFLMLKNINGGGKTFCFFIGDIPLMCVCFYNFAFCKKQEMTMNAFISSLITAVSALSASGLAATAAADDFEGKAIGDTARYVVAYDMDFVQGNLVGVFDHYTEPMRLEIGDKTARFYSYAAFQDDSLNSLRMERGEKGLSYSRKVWWELYKNYPKDGCFTFIDDVGYVNKCAYTEPVKTPEWQLVPDSAATLLGYQCRLAKTRYKGRTWSAWYAEDIPIDAGPWKLGGLPGLILRAYDADSFYVFDATALRQAPAGSVMTYKGEGYEDVTFDELMEQYKRYYADPFGYNRLYQPNARVIWTDDDGNQLPDPKNIKYSPIELSE